TSDCNGDITRDTVVVVLKNERFFDDMLLHEEVSNRRAVYRRKRGRSVDEIRQIKKDLIQKRSWYNWGR
ncbi:TPA: hypothetical protein ACJ7C4_000099, partial [Streptococcus pyogenes]